MIKNVGDERKLKSVCMCDVFVCIRSSRKQITVFLSLDDWFVCFFQNNKHKIASCVGHRNEILTMDVTRIQLPNKILPLVLCRFLATTIRLSRDSYLSRSFARCFEIGLTHPQRVKIHLLLSPSHLLYEHPTKSLILQCE